MTPIGTGLSVENLCFSYPEYPGVPSRQLFTGLDFRLSAGGIAVLLARPDQGKTTLCRIIAGLVPRFTGGELSGRVVQGGVNLLEHHPYQLLERIGLVFQHPGEQLLTSRCDSEIAFALESLGVIRPEIERRLEYALSAMGLERYRYGTPKTLSGGEKKKLLIACLLAVEPQLWLLDETLEELDRGTRKSLLQLLEDQRRSTLILSAKWHELFEEHVDQVFLLEEGKIRALKQPVGSREFQDQLLKRGFVLPREGGRPETTGDRSGSETVLVAEGLQFRYQRDQTRDGGSDFSLQIDRLQLAAGRTTALVGDNGSGKSTLGRILCGLLTPLEGQIRIRTGGPLHRATADELNRFTGYLFQDPDLQIFLPTVFEELALGLKHLHLPTEEIERRVQLGVSLFRLPAADAPPSLMSYGARKKLQAAAYYLLDRPLMIIDEGDSGLSVDDFADMVRIFREQEGALIFITHDRRLADALADEVLEIDAGRFV